MSEFQAQIRYGLEVQSREDNSQELCEKHLKKEKKKTGNLHQGILMAQIATEWLSLHSETTDFIMSAFSLVKKEGPPFNPTTISSLDSKDH